MPHICFVIKIILI